MLSSNPSSSSSSKRVMTNSTINRHKSLSPAHDPKAPAKQTPTGTTLSSTSTSTCISSAAVNSDVRHWLSTVQSHVKRDTSRGKKTATGNHGDGRKLQDESSRRYRQMQSTVKASDNHRWSHGQSSYWSSGYRIPQDQGNPIVPEDDYRRAVETLTYLIQSSRRGHR